MLWDGMSELTAFGMLQVTDVGLELRHFVETEVLAIP